jgi:hypothetical protein
VCLQRKRGRAVGRKTVVPSLCLCAFRCLPEYGMHENRSGSAALFSLVSEAFKSRFCFCFEEGKKKIRNSEQMTTSAAVSMLLDLVPSISFPHKLRCSQCPAPRATRFLSLPSLQSPLGFFHSRRCRVRWVRTRTWLDFREKLLPARGLFV